MSANATLAEMAFYRTERPNLIAQGIVDYDQQCILLKRRWEAIQTLMPDAAAAPAAAAPVHEVAFETPLSASEMRDHGLVLRRVDATNPVKIQYMYVEVQDVNPEPAVTALPPAVCGKRKAVGECSSAPAAKQSNLFNKLMVHLKKDTLQNICEDLDVPVSGNKDELISRITETLR
jgi:hypothetical protein